MTSIGADDIIDEAVVKLLFQVKSNVNHKNFLLVKILSLITFQEKKKKKQKSAKTKSKSESANRGSVLGKIENGMSVLLDVFFLNSPFQFSYFLLWIMNVIHFKQNNSDVKYLESLLHHKSLQNMETVNKDPDKIGNLVNDASYLEQR